MSIILKPGRNIRKRKDPEPNIEIIYSLFKRDD